MKLCNDKEPPAISSLYISIKLASSGTSAESIVPIPRPRLKCGNSRPLTVVAYGT